MVWLSLIASVAATGLSDGWEIHQAQQFCLLRQARPEPAGAELGIALDTKNRARLILTNAGWNIEPDRNYPLIAGIEGSAKERKARGLRLGGDWVALVADVDEQSFIDQLAQSSAVQFEVRKVKPGTVHSRFALAGTAAAVEALRDCQADLIVKTGNLAKQRLDQRKQPITESRENDPDDTIVDR